ncbi:ABC transporter ATP-binding protein [Actinomadura sp. 3N508]|uniref:ABC transporter ATP-binding protein n=1 Tax=Actinomadura sp. 3N508 TaxID=3375153 RepID=UPI0037BBF60F
MGVEGMRQPDWAKARENAAAASGWRTLRAIPGTVAVLVRLTWRASPGLSLLAAFLYCASGVVTSFGLLATGDVFGALLREGPTPDRVKNALPALGLVIAAYATRGGLTSAVEAVRGALTPRAVREADLEVHGAVSQVDLIAFEDASFRELVRQGGRRGVQAVESGVRGVGDVLAGSVALAAALVTVAVLNVWLVPTLLLVAVADGWAAMRVAKLRYETFLGNAVHQMRMFVVGRLLTGRDGAVERHACTLQESLLEEYRRVATDQMKVALRMERRQSVIRLIGRVLVGFGTALAYVVLGALLYSGALALALAGSALIAMRTVSSSLSGSVQAINRLYEDSFYLDFLQRLVEAAAERERAGGDERITRAPETIQLRGVSFTYPGQDTPALTDIELTLKAGEVTALVGENGSGKTTLGKVITGLFPATEGIVCWDGVALAHAATDSVHSRVAVIAQQPAQWPMTAETNVRAGRLEATDPDHTRWNNAITLSSVDQVLDSLPHGHQTVLSREFTEGQDLSGGQWQRLGIARAIYRDGDVLVADEPTAALDAYAEAKVFDGLTAAARHNGRHRHTILVTHRLANVQHADRILVLQNGRIIEEGTHAQLMSSDTQYRRMFRTQAKLYTDQPVPRLEDQAK